MEPKEYWIDWRKEDAEAWTRVESVYNERKRKKQRDMKLTYDPFSKEIMINVNNPKTTPGKYSIVFSPNNWVDWVRYPLIVCHVD